MVYVVGIKCRVDAKVLLRDKSCKWHLHKAIDTHTHTLTHKAIDTHTHSLTHKAIDTISGITYHTFQYRYGVATISRLLKIIGLFCRISSLL